MTDSYQGAPGGSTGTRSTGGAPLGDTSSAEKIVDQARGVRDDFLFGDDRVITNPPNWAAQSSTQLYNGAVNHNDPGFADAMGQTWTGHGKDLHHAAETLYEAIKQLGGAWVGEAAGAAQGALIGVANASSTAGDAARTMGKRMSEQAAAAAEVKKMPPPKEFDFDSEIGRMLAGHPAAMSSADIKAEWDSANAVQAEQQAYMDAYTNSMSQVDGSTPSFGPESIGMKPMSGTNYGGGDGGGFRGSIGVGDGGPSLSAAQGGINAAAPGVNAGAPGQGSAGPLAGQPGTPAPVSNLAHGPLSTSGTAAVSAAASGPGAAGAIGAAAIGAGAGIAGVRAIVKGGGKSGGKKPGERPAEDAQPAAGTADAAATGEQPTGDQAQVPPQQTGWQPPEVRGAAGAAPQQAGATAPAGWQSPEVGAGAVTGQPGAVADPASWQPPQVGDPSATAPQPATQEPLTAGNVTSAGEATASDAVTASTDQGGPAAQSLGHGQQAGQLAQGNAAAMQSAPMAPMGGGGAPMGGAGGGMAGAADAEHQQASYLIEPDPDELFGPGETITSGVIGADDEDD